MRGRFALGTLALAVAFPAAAYLLPARGILRRVGSHRDRLQIHTLVIRGKYTFYGEQAKLVADKMKAPLAGVDLTVPAEAYFRMPGRCAITARSPTGVDADAAWASLSGGKLKVNGPELLPLKLHALLACPLLYERSSQSGDADEMLARVLEGYGVDMETVTLGRFAGDIVYVVGAKPRDLTCPQLWVNKETFEPMRFIAKVDGVLYDARLLDYTSPASGERHPRVVEIFQGETLLGRLAVEKSDENTKVPDATF